MNLQYTMKVSFNIKVFIVYLINIYFFFIYVSKKSRCPIYIIAQKKSRSHALLSKKKCLSHPILYRSHPGDKFCLVPLCKGGTSITKLFKIGIIMSSSFQITTISKANTYTFGSMYTRSVIRKL